MSIDTGLYISHRFSIEDVADVIESRLGVKPEIKTTSVSGYSLICFTYKEKSRQINYHFNCNTPVGNMAQINLNKWGYANEIIRAIGEVLGGLYFDNDCDGNFEFICGELDEGNNLSFHVKNAITSGNAKTLKDVAESVRQWNRDIKKGGYIVGFSDDSNTLIGDSKFGTNLV